MLLDLRAIRTGHELQFGLEYLPLKVGVLRKVSADFLVVSCDKQWVQPQHTEVRQELFAAAAGTEEKRS